MRNRGYESKTAVFRSRNIVEFPHEKIPEDEEEEYIRKLKEAEPSRTVEILPDGSIGYAPSRYFPPDEAQPRRGKPYKDFNPLWDDYSDLER